MHRLAKFAERYFRALFGSMGLFAGGFLLRRHRQLLLNLACHFGYRIETSPTGALPRRAAADLFPEGIPTRLTFTAPAQGCGPSTFLPMGEEGAAPTIDILVLTELVRRAAPATLFEIGTFKGSTTLNFAAATAPDAVIATLDLPPDRVNDTALPIEATERQFIQKNASGTRFVGTPWEAKIRQLYGDSAVFDFGPWQGRCDFVFVDGSHAYDYVLSDARNALKLLKGGRGMVVFHDYGQWGGVTRGLDELKDDPAFAGLFNIEGTSLGVLDLRG